MATFPQNPAQLPQKARNVSSEQIRLLLERTNGFAGGGSQPFNHFLAELTARADLFAAAGNCVEKKILLTFRMPHGFDFATQNLGAREEFLHLIRKPPPLRKTVGFPNPCGNFSTKSRPTTPKMKVVRPEQIPVAFFPQKSHPEARQTAGMRYNV